MVPAQRQGEMRGSASLEGMWQILQIGRPSLGSSATSSMSSAAAAASQTSVRLGWPSMPSKPASPRLAVCIHSQHNQPASCSGVTAAPCSSTGRRRRTLLVVHHRRDYGRSALTKHDQLRLFTGSPMTTTTALLAAASPRHSTNRSAPTALNAAALHRCCRCFALALCARSLRQATRHQLLTRECLRCRRYGILSNHRPRLSREKLSVY